ncbi:aspartate/glutamate racemase family protein [candidate division KSB1 bacterium]
MNTAANASEIPVIGILGWELRNEGTLSQLEDIPGNIAHPDTFSFPVLYKRVEGAYYQTVVVQPNKNVLRNMIETAREMERDGIQAIMTNCGFNAVFQRELADAVSVPFFASSLIQVPLVYRMLKRKQKVGIITADKKCLTKEHLENVGISGEIPVCIAGIENTEEFSRIRNDSKAALDIDKFRREIVGVSKQLVNENKDVGAVVLECTDLPPFAAVIRKEVGLPVFDIVTLAHMVYESVAGDRWGWKKNSN